MMLFIADTDYFVAFVYQHLSKENSELRLWKITTFPAQVSRIHEFYPWAIWRLANPELVALSSS